MGHAAWEGPAKAEPLLKVKDGTAYEISMDVTPGTASTAGLILYNDKEEKVKIYLDMDAGRLVMDRTESGITDLTKWGNYDVHVKETDDHRKTMSVNYKNDFALGTWAPLSLCDGEKYHMDIFVDKCSVEIFVDGGRIAMTNLVFPTSPYDCIGLYTEGGKMAVENMTVYQLGL